MEMGAQIRMLEGKLMDIEDCLMNKVREVTASREVQASLRMELDSLKTMIVSEEERSVRHRCARLSDYFSRVNLELS